MIKKLLLLILILLIILFVSSPAFSQQIPLVLPKITVEAGEADEPQELVLSLQILLLLTILSLAPAILIMVTSFTRIVVVLGFVRNALGSPQIPPTAVIIGLSLFLTFFIMAPTFGEIQDNALSPYLAGSITQEEALNRGVNSLRNFMFRQTQEKDLALLVSFTDLPRPQTRNDIPTHVLIPAFILSELRAAFTLGFLIYIPFLVIDMVVASILMSMGMMMLPPVMISLPFKLLLFVLVDGWDLITRGLTLSFR